MSVNLVSAGHETRDKISDRRHNMFPSNSPRHGQLGGYQQQPGYEYGGGGAGVYGEQWPPNYHLYR